MVKNPFLQYCFSQVYVAIMKDFEGYFTYFLAPGIWSPFAL